MVEVRLDAASAAGHLKRTEDVLRNEDVRHVRGPQPEDHVFPHRRRLIPEDVSHHARRLPRLHRKQIRYMVGDHQLVPLRVTGVMLIRE